MCRIPIAALPQREPRLFPVVSRQPCAHRFRGSLDWAIRNFGQHRRIARSAQDGLHPVPVAPVISSGPGLCAWVGGAGLASPPHCSRWRRSVGPKEPCSNPLLRPGWSSNHEISGGKVLSGNTKKVKHPAAKAFRMAAQSLSVTFLALEC